MRGKRAKGFLTIRIGRLISVSLAICLLTSAMYGDFTSLAADLPPKDSAAPVSNHGSATFNQCVRLALEQSPYLTSSSLEIDVRRLDESDSRYGLFPSLSLRTRYYVNPPKDTGGESRPYSLGFFIDSYNPVESYFSLQANKLVTKMAIIGHLRVISGAIQRLGDAFLELASLGRMAAFQDEIVAAARKNLAYTSNLAKSGTVGSLEAQLAEQEVRLAQMERDRITEAQAVHLDAIKTLLGLREADALDLDLSNASRQVLDAFDPEAATFDEARSASYELKIQNLKKELQTLNVSLAYARFLPTFLMGVENGDPLSGVSQGGYYIYFGAEMPIWDGLRRVRNVSRQKTILKQFSAEERIKVDDLGTTWNNAKTRLASAATSLALARSQQELATLKKRQSEISYGEGREPLPQHLAESKKLIEARKNSELKELEYAKAALSLYALSGKMSQRYVQSESY